MLPYLIPIVVSLLLVVLGAYLVPLLIQLRKTAYAVEELSRSAARDISRVADDVHQIRSQAMEISSMTKEFLELPTSMAQSIQSAASALPAFFNNQSHKMGILGVVTSGVKTLFGLFRRT